MGFIEDIIITTILMILLLSVLNVIYINTMSKKLKTISEVNMKKFKREWRWISFIDIPLAVLSFFIISFITSNLYLASMLSLIIAFAFIAYIGSRIVKSEYFEETKTDCIKVFRNNANMNLNAKSQDMDRSLGEMRKLTINRIKAFPSILAPTHIYIDTDCLPSEGFEVRMHEKCFKRVRVVSYGKSVNVNIPIESIVLLFANSIGNVIQNYKQYSLPSGNDDVILNVKPILSRSTGDSFHIEQG